MSTYVLLIIPMLMPFVLARMHPSFRRTFTSSQLSWTMSQSNLGWRYPGCTAGWRWQLVLCTVAPNYSLHDTKTPYARARTSCHATLPAMTRLGPECTKPKGACSQKHTARATRSSCQPCVHTQVGEYTHFITSLAHDRNATNC